MPAKRAKGKNRNKRVAALLLKLKPHLNRTISPGRTLIIVSVIQDTGNAAKALGHKGPGPNPPGVGLIETIYLVG
jgi:hypothetical protein